MEFYHTPVLLDESVELLDIQPHGTYVDLTFGGGGHSRAILERLSPEGKLYGFDQDSEARVNIPDDERLHFVEGNFRFMRGLLRERQVTRVDGVLADLGVSSHHFDSAERGFSFRADAPLDMRMNRGGKSTAAQVVGTAETQRLIAIFRDYGELDGAHKIAGRIVEARRNAPLQTTHELIEAVRPLIPRSDENRWLSKLFQALRIEVNGEMEALKMALEQSLKVLKPGGRLVIISYHSLEDRLVKNFFKSGNFEGSVEKDFYGRPQTPFELVTRKAVVPTDDEIARNPRSRSAKLRAATKLADADTKATTKPAPYGEN
ncbi:MAG: 16S rRNA (cytosine(1402)-N(4))-methyltransferase RsmH [Alistipes sp.]|nr:16S rRNA (cytosine(1402)-N(4))-methyltransferase RsmH [Alistipes sp.]